ncbi:MAG: GNAT family N-acetyltransferase, partial [Armatimonadetes bacterium]|nr:GNAT family N-acetyltransferase [Armatimonadota bacterium]
MNMSEYELTDYVSVTDAARQFVDLSNVAFAEYEGAMEFGYEWGEWYLRRPGTDPRLCQAALAEGKLVSQVLVAVQELQIGGDLLRCGIIDSVATHPEHRKQGLARALMDRAHEAMRENAQVDAAVLYTNPAGHPYRFYGRLGYLTRAQAALITGPRPDAEAVVEAVDPGEVAGELMRLLNGYYAGHEGYAPLNDAMWRWHKLEVPAGTGLEVAARIEDGRAVATVSFTDVELLLGG